ncbi:L-2-hydroxyglutarate oxidase [Nodosilinea sp. LEGE 07088]|uniref:L-2-hydroxyglutarate oxidase n=1 Tax=Nodosilinea sp. LEGE 07088 TaxID=2777968 RepID=UPI00187FC439|nr:L-2-hydroxyglutarate oxidase [Nodosilinea sp. LEGE 07088]MBE9136292.1 L-2-hydroxyglutarate oxidase [Nodosilinea sp. LEGE 07088]
MYDVAIVGGGIVGLSTAMTLGRQYSNLKILVLEKESQWGHHQTGHNSGVIHSGIYYKPGSLKAKLCRDGCAGMVAFCEANNIAYDVCGKVIVATEINELPYLEKLYQRGLENGLEVCKLSAEETQEIEPHVRCLASIRVFSTGIADYKQVCQAYVKYARDQGADLKLNTRLENLVKTPDGYTLETTVSTFSTRFLVNCAGLQSDLIAKQEGANPQAKIVPFRGEYYELVPEKRGLVKHLIYPVPNPNFPFLGVHFTRMIDGSVHAGPNAVLSLKREGYSKFDFDFKDFADVMTYGGFWKLAARHADEGLKEIIRSFSKAAFVRSLQRLIPEVESADLVPTHAGVRAQALAPDGKLVDDFLLIQRDRAVHVCNAPSPAATSSIEIGKEIVRQISAQLGTVLNI